VVTRATGALTFVLLFAATADVAQAEARSTASERAEVRKMLAPIGVLDRTVQTRRAELDQLAATWAAGVGCLQSGYAELGRQADGGTLTETEASSYGAILFSVALLDATVALAEPLDGELARAQRAYRRMTLGDRVLRAGARAKAREIAALRRLPDIDTCRFTETWTATGFSLLDLPDVAPGLAITDDIGGSAATRAVARAARRLRRLGMSKSRAGAFSAFPLFPVADPALEDGGLFPPG
jgi:hypothetical protein